MKTNFWKIGVIVLSFVLLGGILFFIFSDRSVPTQTQSSPANTELSGDVFVITQGSGNVKIGLAEIVAENQETKEIYKTTTNADGRFSLVVPPGSYLIAGKASRTYQCRLRGDADYKDTLDKNSMDKSQAENHRHYMLYTIDRYLRRQTELGSEGVNREALERAFLNISEYYRWKLTLDVKQPKQSLQLSNNNITDFGLE